MSLNQNPEDASIVVGKKQPLTFDFFPPEIREPIFMACLEWNGKTPSLIAAVRGSKFYAEVMESFRKKENTFILHEGNGWSFGEMSSTTTLSIRRLRIVVKDYRWVEWWNQPANDNEAASVSLRLIAVPSAADVADATSLASNVMDLHIVGQEDVLSYLPTPDLHDFEDDIWWRYVHNKTPDLCRGLCTYLDGFMYLRQLRFTPAMLAVPGIAPNAWRHHEDIQQEGIELVNDLLGAKGKLSYVGTFDAELIELKEE